MLFSPEDKEKLIKELNIQLENKEFYSVDDDIALPSNIFEEFETIQNLKYANLASVTGSEFEKTSSSIQNIYDLTNNYCESSNFKSVGLFRPLVNSEFNPLDKTVYNYQATYAAPVHGLAFMGNDGGVVENTVQRLYKVVDNSAIIGTVGNNNEVVSANSLSTKEILANDSSKIAITPIAYNTYQMADILKNTIDSQIIDFKAIPRELALAKASKWRNIWFKEIDILGAIKNIFAKR